MSEHRDTARPYAKPNRAEPSSPLLPRGAAAGPKVGAALKSFTAGPTTGDPVPGNLD